MVLCLALIREGAEKDALWLVPLTYDVLPELVLSAQHILEESLDVSDSARVLSVALFGRELSKLDFMPGKVVLGESDGPVKILHEDWIRKLEVWVHLF